MAVVNPVIFDNDDDEGPIISFKRASTSVKNRPTLSNQEALKGLGHQLLQDHNNKQFSIEDGDGDQEAQTSEDDANLRSGHGGIFDNDDDEGPIISFKRASTSVKNRPTLSKQKALKGLDHQLLQDHNDEQFNVEDGDGDQEAQKSEDHANLRSGYGGAQGGRPKKHKGTTSIPRIEETMLAHVDLNREQSSMKEKASKQGQQYSISRCLEVLHGMDDVSDEIKVLASDVLKDAASREFFLCYESRLRGLWLKKEVGKLGTQLPP